MLKINVDESLYTSRAPSTISHPESGPRSRTPLEILLKYAAQDGFQIVGIDIAKIRNHYRHPPYQSPVILLHNRDTDATALVSLRDDGLEKYYDILSYHQ